MNKLAYILLLLSFNVCAEVSEEGQRFCLAWSQDARQGAEKRDEGVEYDRIERLINEIPNDVFSPERKLMATSAVRWVYYFKLDAEEAKNLGYIRCTACVDEDNRQACIVNFDKSVEEYQKAKEAEQEEVF